MPNATAVEFQQSQLSYAELHGRANQLARRLLQLAAPRDRVCVVLDRSPTQVVAWLALLKAGIAYAPVDPASPVQRLNFLLTDLEPSVVLTQCALAPRLPPGMARVICLDDPAELACLAQLAAEPLRSEPVLEDPACFLSTSGSTGLPKASILSYSNLEFIAQTFGEAFDVGRTDRVLQLSSMVFDFALGELILALRAGATLVMGQWIDLRPGPALAGFLVNHRITVLAATPSALRVTPPPAKSAVRLILFGGEMLSVKTVLDWSHRCRVSNTCGPSECSFWATRDECVADGQRTTIGRPVENCRVYVLDANLSLQPVGAPGEMFVGGAGVGLGYWNRPDLTTERFLADPFAGQPDARMYRTGDQVRWLADGRLEYLGRLDHQVKFRGVRLELGEIEATLQNHPGVQHAVVAVVDDRLEAWLVADEPQPAIDRISAWLADRLPMMCIPTEFHFLAEFPRTGSGKIERQALLTQTRAGSGCQPQLPAPRRFDPVLAEWSGVEMPFPRERSVVDIFRDQARTRPEATALEDETQLMSYRELDILSNRVAHRLIRAGLRAEETVALLLDPSCLFAVAALGVLKAGGSYLPIAVDTTAHRLAFLLADSGARLALVNSSDMDRCASWSGLSFPVDAAGSAFADESDAEPSMPASPDRKAYVIYTSGSTGQPKGVEIEHHSLTNLVCFYQRRLGLTPRDRTTMIASVSFDASVADLWPGLCAGGTVIIPPRSLITDIDGLIAWLAAKRATFAFVPTVLAELMLGRPWPPLMALRFFATGGETLRVRPPGGLPFTVLNTYGPTENTVDSTWSVVSPAGSEQRPPIGRPIDNVKVYVLDERGESSPCGVAGELYLGGEQVARGYLGRPDLTAQHFLPDPFASDPGARMYRTGDWVRWHSEGELEYLGRQDDQVQIRGQRVELGEIEHALGVHPAVRQACCRAIQDDDTVTGVVAHVVPLPNQPDLQDQLRLYLANRLPAAMVPSAFVFHEFFPVTQQGKVDRGALDAAAVPTRQCAGMVPPSDGIDRGLARIWEEMFPHGSEMNAETSFSALGGDSLLAVKLLLAVEELAGCRVAFSTFLLDPTLAGLSRAVKAQESANHPVVIALRRSGSRPPIFCIYDLSGDVGVYFDLADALGPDQPVFGVRSPALLNPEAVPQSMEAAAAEALRCIRQIQPTLAPVLVGYSWAGLLAFEVARQWMREETSIPLVCLLGTCAPLQQSTPASRLAHFIRWIPHWLHQWARDRGDRRRRLVNAAKRQVKGSMTPKASTPVPDWASTPLTREHILLARRYAPSVTHTLQVELFRERPDYMAAAHPLHAFATSHEPDGGWARWTGCPPRLYWIDSTHTSLFKAPAVGALAIAIRTAIDQYHGV
jgi:amino acid adenylation domain-containing protein